MKRVLTLLLLLAALPLLGAQFTLRHEISGWVRAWLDDDRNSVMESGRYQPELSATLLTTESGLMLDARVAGKAEGWSWHDKSGENDSDFNADLYRGWLRYSGTYWEARAGLQKLNFGPARMLRSLQWFDQLDPRDPLQQTEGVWAALARVYFANNANLWAWVVRGEAKQRGVLVLKSEEDGLEPGARFECPIIDGTLGLTFHHRELAHLGTKEASCNSYAVDGRWDWAFGFWVEMAAHHYRDVQPNPEWLKQYTVGGDYTFAVGNGIYTQLEGMLVNSGESLFDETIDNKLVALSANYSLGILDQVTLMLTYDVEADYLIRYASWQRTWDYVSAYINVIWNPSQYTANYSYTETGLSVQFMLSANF